MTTEPWKPGTVLITRPDLSEAIQSARLNGLSLAPSPANAAFVVDLVIYKMGVRHQNTKD